MFSKSSPETAADASSDGSDHVVTGRLSHISEIRILLYYQSLEVKNKYYPNNNSVI